MNKRGSSNIQGDARVYGPSVGLNSGTIHTTYHITHQYSAANPYLVDEQALASASARLAELPIDSVAEPTQLPLGSRMPFARNPLFVGRLDYLQLLASTMTAIDAGVIEQTAAVTGLGGIGKTQLASEFVHRYGQYFAGGVFWLNFSEPANVPREIAACGDAGHMALRPDFSSLTLEDQAQLVVSALMSPLPRLLIFDNCENEALLARWRPVSGGSRVIITSRRAVWDVALRVKVIEVGALTREESILLLHQFRPDLLLVDAELNSIAAMLGDLPLALHLAGGFLKSFQHSQFGVPTVYLTKLQKGILLRHPSLEGTGTTFSPTAHELSVARTFDLSFVQLDPANLIDSLAIQLLQHASYLAWEEPISRNLLIETLDLAEDDESVHLRVVQAITRLLALGLLENMSSGWLRLHRLLALFVRDVAADETAQNIVERTLVLAAHRLAEQDNPALYADLQIHLHDVADAAVERDSEAAPFLCDHLAHYYFLSGSYVESQDYYEIALRIKEKKYGSSHHTTAHSLNGLGIVLTFLGEHVEARRLLERALRINEQANDPAELVQSLNNLAHLLSTQNEHVAARRIQERALRLAEQVYGNNHPTTAVHINNLARLIQDEGNYDESRALFEQALAITASHFGDDHPTTAIRLNNLGLLHYEQQNYSRALPLFERALANRQHSLGPDHPSTAQSLANLAGVLRKLGDYSRAQQMLEQALLVRESVLGLLHTETLTNLDNLVSLLTAKQDFQNARSLLNRAFTAAEQNLGSYHQLTADRLYRLAVWVNDNQADRETYPLLEQALTIMKQSMNLDFSRIAEILACLSILDARVGNFQIAVARAQEGVEMLERSYGPRHHETQSAKRYLDALKQLRSPGQGHHNT